MSRIDDDTVVHLLKDSVGEPPYRPDRFERIVAKAVQQKHRRTTEALGTLCIALTVLGAVVAVDRRDALGDPLTVVTAAAGNAADVGSMRFEGEMEFAAGTQTYRTTMNGSVDFARERSEFSMAMSLPGAPDNTTRMLQIGSTVYISSSALFPKADAGGKRWIAMAQSSVSPSQSIAAAWDPRTMLETLNESADSVESVGRETVRGVRTTRYRVVNSPPTSPTTSVADGLFPERADVWIDDDGLPRRMSVEIDVSELGIDDVSPEDLSDATSEFTMDFFDYGAEVDITAPAAAEVISADDPLLTGSFGANLECMTEKMAAASEQIKARVAAGESVDQAEMQKLFADVNATCAADAA